MARDGRSDERQPARSRPTVKPSPMSERSALTRYRPAAGLRLPRTDERERIDHRNRGYRLNGEEARVLATVGAFRVVPAAELETDRQRGMWDGPIRELAEQGLVERKTVVVNNEARAIVVLTRAGKAVLDASHYERADRRRQQYHAGFVKPREVAHDSQLHRLFQTAAGELEERGYRIDRVVLDYELKREYQRFLNRPDRDHEGDADTDVRAFAEAHGLPVVDGHLELPDLRIEYETPDGRLEYRDLELVTEHYSRGQLAGKSRAGFALYRAAGSPAIRGGRARTGGTPFDPHNLEWLR
jgi:DNA-binding MarR family transcriptional regulator